MPDCNTHWKLHQPKYPISRYCDCEHSEAGSNPVAISANNKRTLLPIATILDRHGMTASRRQAYLDNARNYLAMTPFSNSSHDRFPATQAQKALMTNS